MAKFVCGIGGGHNMAAYIAYDGLQLNMCRVSLRSHVTPRFWAMRFYFSLRSIVCGLGFHLVAKLELVHTEVSI